MQKKILPRNNIKIGLATPRFTGSLEPIFLSIKNLYSYFSLHQQTHSDICAAANEQWSTYLALWKTDGLYQLLDGVELQRVKQPAGNLIYHL